MKKAMPEIVALGIYDGALVHKNRVETPSRRVRLYEIESILEDGAACRWTSPSSPSSPMC